MRAKNPFGVSAKGFGERDEVGIVEFRGGFASRLLSTGHFSVDGTLIEVWASTKSLRPKDGSDEPPAGGSGRNKEANFYGTKR